MIKDIILLLAGALLGNIDKISRLIKQLWINRINNTQKKIMGKINIYSWLIKYYEKNKTLNDLFNCNIGGFEVKIPFFSKAEWQVTETINPSEDNILVYSEPNRAFNVNNKLINYRKRLGQELFDAPTLYLDRIGKDKFKLFAKKCRYFEMASNLFSLEEETIQAAYKNKSTPIRNEYFKSVECCEKLLKKPFSLGCTTALVLKTPKGWELALHKRSNKTVTYGNKLAVIPNYGLSIPLFALQDNKKINLLVYNFIKEYCEELFNYEEIIKLANTNRGDPLWFYSLQESKELQSMLKDGKLELKYLGFGFDLFNGTSNIAMAAIISDETYVDKFKHEIKVNWEVRKDNDTAPVIFVDYRDVKLREWLINDEYQFGSAFTIAKTIELLENNNL